MCFKTVEKRFIENRQPVGPINGKDMISDSTPIHLNRWNRGNLDYIVKTMVSTDRDYKMLSAMRATDPMFYCWENYKYSNEPFENCDDQTQYVFVSGRIESQTPIDIYKPGRIVSRIQIPERFNGAVRALWLYFEDHEGRDVYFEIDIFEFMPPGFVFSVHVGEHAPPDCWSSRSFLKIPNSGWYYPELIWNGFGRFIWKLDGVTMKAKTFELPPDVQPVLIHSIGVRSPIDHYTHFDIYRTEYLTA